MTDDHKEYEDFPQNEFDDMGSFSMNLAFSVMGVLSVVGTIIGFVCAVWG